MQQPYVVLYLRSGPEESLAVDLVVDGEALVTRYRRRCPAETRREIDQRIHDARWWIEWFQGPRRALEHADGAAQAVEKADEAPGTPLAEELEHTGRLLGALLFGDPTNPDDAPDDNDLWRAVMQLLRGERGLSRATFAVATNDAGILAWPWELLLFPPSAAALDGARPAWFVGVNSLRMLRLFTANLVPPPAELPARLWLCASSPTDRAGFNTYWAFKQAEGLQERLGPYVAIGHECLAPTREQFLDELAERDAVIFIGHGSYDPPGLVLTRGFQAGRALESDLLPAQDLAARLMGGDCRTRLLVLNGCYSMQVAASLYLHASAAGPAQPCEMPVIVAMNFSWSVSDAFDLQERLLTDLLIGRPRGVSRAVADWRAGAFTSLKAGTRWAVPTILFPALRTTEELETADTLARRRAVVADHDRAGRLAATRGPRGLTAHQRALVDEALVRLFPDSYQVQQRLMTAHLPADCEREYEVAPFALDVFPVTVHLYRWWQRTYHAGRPELLEFLGDGHKPHHPVLVPFAVAREFCADMGGRLPSADEWERAARGTSHTILPGLADDLDALLRARLTPTGELRYNVAPQAPEDTPAGPVSVFATPAGASPGLGVRDMIGNAPEFALVSHEEPDPADVHVMGAEEGYNAPAVLQLPCLRRRQRLSAENGLQCAFRCAYDLSPEGSRPLLPGGSADDAPSQ